MNHYIISSLATSFTTIPLALLVYLKNRKHSVNRAFAIYTLSIGVWSFGFYKMITSTVMAQGFFWSRALHIGALFIPTLFLHFVLVWLERASLKRKIIIGTYIASFTFLLLCPTRLFILPPVSKFNFKYFVNPGILYHSYTAFFFICVVYTHYELFRAYRKTKGLKRNQLKYLFLAYWIGYSGGATAFFPLFNINMPSRSLYTIPLCMGLITLIIIQYHLLDINIVIRKGTARVIISVLFWSCIMLIHLADAILTAKMILYGLLTIALVSLLPRLIKKAESAVTQIFYKDKYKYQDKLREIPSTIPTIYDMERLFKYTIDATSEAVECSPCSIMLVDSVTKNYSIEYNTGLPDELVKRITFYSDTEIIQKLRWGNRPIVKEEFTEDDPVRERMDSIKAEVSVPIVRKDKLIAILNLNHKASGDIYSHEDLSILTDISKYLGMAIENIALSKREHQEELITYLNNIAYALAHELKNRSQTMVTTAHGILSMLPQVTNVPQDLITLAKTANDNMLEIDSIVNELVAYSNVQQIEGYGPVDIADILNESLSITGGEIKTKKINVVKRYAESNMKHGDRGQLIQVFVSVIRNGIEAMEEGGILTLGIQAEGEFWKISIEDTGKGIPLNHLGSIFEPFFTTKHDHKGLGLSIARRIVYDHAGEIKPESVEGKGTIVYIYLPKQMPEDKLKARSEIKRREDISYDRIKTKDYQDKLKKESQNGQA